MTKQEKNACREGLWWRKIVLGMICIAIFTSFLQGVSALDWSNNTFNNSLTSENLLFISESNADFTFNKTKYLSIPQNVLTVTNGFINFTGLLPTGGSDTVPYNYSLSGSTLIQCSDDSIPATEAVDGDFGTCGYREISSNFFTNLILVNYQEYYVNKSDLVNYSVSYNIITCDLNPGACKANFKISFMNWTSGSFSQVFSRNNIFNSTGINFNENISIDSDYIKNGILSVRENADLFRLGGSGVTRIRYYDGRVYDTGSSLPSNNTLNVGNNSIDEWIFQGIFGQSNNRTSNLASTINQFLNATYLIGTNYVIPFIFHSDTAGILQYLDMLFSNKGFLENSQSFTQNVSETDEQSFSINLSYDTGRYDFISADLIYNGTRKTGTQIGSGTNVLFNSSFDIPLIPNSDESEIRDVYWEVSLTEGSSTSLFNSTVQSQNVSRIHLEQCDATYTIQALNFTAFDESDSSRINPYYFAGDFDFWLGSGTVKKSNTFSNTSISEVGLCISPVDKNFSVDANIEYNDFQNSTTYPTRNYFFQKDIINNQTQHIPLFLLKSSDSTSFILKVQDINLLPVSEALIIIQRFNPGTGNFTTVSIAKTDDNGQSIGFFKTETVDYRFIIKKDGEILLQTNQQKIIPETAPFTLTFTVGIDTTVPWAIFEDLSDLTKSLTFNSTTGNVTFSYVDTSGQFTLGKLVLQTQNLSGFSETICNVNSSSSSAILVCGTGNASGTYTASAFITRGSDVFLVEQIIFTISTLADTTGLYGMFLAWFIILISAFAFKFNEVAGIVLMNLTVITTNIIGLVNFGNLFIFAMIGVSTIIIVMLKK